MTTPEEDRQTKLLETALRAGRQDYKRAQYPGDLAGDMGLNKAARWMRLGQLRWPITAGAALAAAIVVAAGVWWVLDPPKPTAENPTAETPPQVPQVVDQARIVEPESPALHLQPVPVASGLTRSDMKAITLRAKGQFAASQQGQRTPSLPSVVLLSTTRVALDGFSRPDFPMSPVMFLRSRALPSSFSLPSRKDLL